MKPVLLGIHLVDKGIITREQLDTALEIERNDRLIGEIAVEQDFISPESIHKIVAYMGKTPDVRFGEAAVKLGYITSSQLRYLLGLRTREKVRIGDILVREGYVTYDVLHQELLEIDIEKKRIKKILVCETTITVTRILRQMLEQCGYDVLTAKTGKEALLAAVKEQPDMIVASRELDDMDGLALCFRLASDPTTAKIISVLISDDIDKATIDDAFDSGVTFVLQKPITQKELMNIIYQIEMDVSEKRREKILIVDDSPIARMAVFKELSGMWADIHMAKNGKEGLAKAKEILPDIITMDWEMPEMNGLEACEKLKETPATQNIPVVMITSLDTTETRAQGFEAGAVEYFTKPFRQGSLAAFMTLLFDTDRVKKNRKVMIVEDSKTTQHILKYFFIKNGYDIEVAENGREALRLMAQNELPDIVLTDCYMPQMDGFRLTERIKRRLSTQHIPIIMLTGSTTKADVIKGLTAGATDYVIKPFDESELLARVETHLKNRALMEELAEEKEKLRVANEELQRLSSTDALTQIANRRSFDEFLDREWRRAEREGIPLSLILIDIDFFKKYNDKYGHQEGDECLKKVAQALAQSVHRPGDMVARYGGEEFVLVLASTPAKDAVVMAERLRKAVESLLIRHARSDVADVVTLSLGVASQIPEQNSLPDQIVKAADDALYTAKKEGRNRVELAK